MSEKAGSPADKREGGSNRAADRVIAALEGRIFSGELAGGEMLPPERELMEEFEISRTVAREAVKILGGKGLVEIRPRYRPVVKMPDYDTALGVVGGLVKHLIGQAGGVRQLFEVRIFIESGLVRMAAMDAGKDDIRKLREALARNEESIEDSDRFYRTDMAFHAVLYTIPENPIFPAVHRAFCDWLEGHWIQMPRLPERNRRNHQSHSAIFEAITYRDPDLAEAALRSHLDDAWSQVERTFGYLK